MTQKIRQRLVQFIFLTLVAVLLLMPLHGFLTTWIGSNTGGLLFWRAWKELLILPSLVAAAVILFCDRKTLRLLLADRFHQIMLLFSLLIVLLALLVSKDVDATLLGATMYLRVFALYLLGWIVARYKDITTAELVRLIILPSLVVVGFGLLQLFVLPYDFLQHFGYQKNVTIPPFFTIDEQLWALRIASTLRGPNALGVYLILPIMAVVVLGWHTMRQQGYSMRNRVLAALVLVGSLVVLYSSHSRSAWLGLLMALTVWAAALLSQRLRYVLLGLFMIGSLVGSVLIYQHRDAPFVANTILHNNPETGGEVDSNQVRVAVWSDSLRDIRQRPLSGCGPGCAGPASFHHEDGAKIAENSYLQVLQEMGIMGFLLYGVLGTAVAWRLWLQRTEPLALILLTSFVGVSFAGLLLHTWADDTIACVWWVLAGLYLYNKPKTNTKGIKNVETKTKVQKTS